MAGHAVHGEGLFAGRNSYRGLPMKACALRGFLLAGFVLASAARADITVGVDIATTGPAAAIGIPTKNVVMMWPQTLGGQKAHYVILDDGSDPTNTVTNVRKLTSE